MSGGISGKIGYIQTTALLKSVKILSRVLETRDSDSTNAAFINQDWKTVKTESEKINDLLPHISTNYITELNYLIYTGAKLV